MERIVVYNNPVSPVAEAYRSMCTNVLSGLGNKKIIEVVGVTNNSGVSIVTANLAVAMAQAGKKVLIADCNLREPKLHDIFRLENSGLKDCLSMTDDYDNYVQATKQNNLFVLTAGTATIKNPAETLLSAAMQDIVNDIKETYDIVIIDAPSVGSVSDAVALGTKTDGVLLVITNKKDKVEQAQKAKAALLQARVNILGCVLVKVGIS